MPLTLHQLKGSKRRRHRRLGRGTGSGRGTTAGRGTKGQRSRTGGRKGLKLRGVKQFILQFPKNRGFRSLNEKPAILNLDILEKTFEKGARVTIDQLRRRGLLDASVSRVKILGNGALTKALFVEASAFSESAKNAIIKAGGSIKVLPMPGKKPVKSPRGHGKR